MFSERNLTAGLHIEKASFRIRSIIGNVVLIGLLASTASASILVTQTTSEANLISALGGTGLSIDSVSIVRGDPLQFGVYSGFSDGPVVLSDGIVMSTGVAAHTANAPVTGNNPNTNLFGAGSPTFDAYGPSNIENFNSSNDVASLQLDFTLSSPSAVAFDFVFGSVEFPDFVSEFTDAFLSFLDGSVNQVVFDDDGDPVQVGLSFASSLTTSDQNTAFAGRHGLLGPLTTTTQVLDIGPHSLLFEIGDVNDNDLDSAVFITDFRLSTSGNSAGTAPLVVTPAPPPLTPSPGGSGLQAIPGPPTFWLLVVGMIVWNRKIYSQLVSFASQPSA